MAHVGWGWLLAFLVAVSGLVGSVLLAVGIILLLCESSWGKPRGKLGSTGFLLTGACLMLPLAIYLLPLAWQS
jgi:hypothetical protein